MIHNTLYIDVETYKKYLSKLKQINMQNRCGIHNQII